VKSLCMSQRHSGGADVYLFSVLTSVLDGGEWSTLHPGPVTLAIRARGTHWIGGLLCPRYYLGIVRATVTSQILKKYSQLTVYIARYLGRYWVIQADICGLLCITQCVFKKVRNLPLDVQGLSTVILLCEQWDQEDLLCFFL
jgi:hypothetical protein